MHAVEAIRIYRALNRNQRNTFLACFLGWTLDALDFFLLTFVVTDVAGEFSVSHREGDLRDHAHPDDAARSARSFSACSATASAGAFR